MSGYYLIVISICIFLGISSTPYFFLNIALALCTEVSLEGLRLDTIIAFFLMYGWGLIIAGYWLPVVQQHEADLSPLNSTKIFVVTMVEYQVVTSDAISNLATINLYFCE